MISEDLTHWVDDLYDMGEAGLRAEAERYVRLARRYKDSPDKEGYKYAYIRHREAITLLEARSAS